MRAELLSERSQYAEGFKLGVSSLLLYYFDVLVAHGLVAFGRVRWQKHPKVKLVLICYVSQKRTWCAIDWKKRAI